MEKREQFLTLILDEVDQWAMATCPEFKIGTFGDTKDNAKERLFENVKVASYVLVKQEERDIKVDRRLIKYARIINNNGAFIKDYFRELEVTKA